MDASGNKLDKTLLLLFFGIVLFTLVLFAAEIWFMSDSQMFQVIASVLAGFTGAFFGRIKPSHDQPPNVTATSTPAKATATISADPPADPK